MLSFPCWLYNARIDHLITVQYSDFVHDHDVQNENPNQITGWKNLNKNKNRNLIRCLINYSLLQYQNKTAKPIFHLQITLQHKPFYISNINEKQIHNLIWLWWKHYFWKLKDKYSSGTVYMLFTYSKKHTRINKHQPFVK